MQPESTPTPPPTDPFAFLNEAHKPSPLQSLGTNLTGRSKIVFAVGAIVVIIILLVLVKSFLGGNKGVDINSIDTVLTQQQEVINLANTGVQQQQVMSQSYLNFTYTAIGSATTAQTKLLKLLSYNGVKVSSSLLTKVPTTNTQLQDAEQTSTFDSIYSQVMNQQLAQYKTALNSAYVLNKSAVIKSYLVTDYKNTLLLLKMLGSSYG